MAQDTEGEAADDAIGEDEEMTMADSFRLAMRARRKSTREYTLTQLSHGSTLVYLMLSRTHPNVCYLFELVTRLCLK